MAGAQARPCSSFIMTGWSFEAAEQAGLKGRWRPGRRGSEDKPRGGDGGRISEDGGDLDSIRLVDPSVSDKGLVYLHNIVKAWAGECQTLSEDGPKPRPLFLQAPPTRPL